LIEQQEFELLDLFNQVVKNESLACRNITLGDHGTFIIPPQSDFFMGDLETISELNVTGKATESIHKDLTSELCRHKDIRFGCYGSSLAKQKW
jgi:hypothetical protein